jgi:hypothetical protein
MRRLCVVLAENDIQHMEPLAKDGERYWMGVERLWVSAK